MRNEKNSYPDVGEQRKALYWVTFMSCGFYYVTSKSSFPLNSHLLRHQFSLFSVFLSVILPCPPPPPSLLSLLSFRNRCTEQLAPLSLFLSFPLLLLNISPYLSLHFLLSRCIPLPNHFSWLYSLLSQHFCTNFCICKSTLSDFESAKMKLGWIPKP